MLWGCEWIYTKRSRIPVIKNGSGGTLGTCLMAVFDLFVAFGDLLNLKHKIIYHGTFRCIKLVYKQKILNASR